MQKETAILWACKEMSEGRVRKKLSRTARLKAGQMILGHLNKNSSFEHGDEDDHRKTGVTTTCDTLEFKEG